MTCIVLVKNPETGAVSAITEDYNSIAQYADVEDASSLADDQVLVRAWGGYVVDLDNLEVTEI